MINLDTLENELLNKLLNMPERKEIKQIEEEIFSNEECILLISNFQKAQEDYNFTLKMYKENSIQAQQKQKELYQAKLKMDQNKLINRYNLLLKEINEPLRYLDYKLISLFQKRSFHRC